MQRTSRAAIAALLVSVPLVAGGAIWQSREQRDGAMLFDQVLRQVATRFVDTVDASGLYEKAARGLVAQLNDPYTVLYTPKEFAAFTQSTNGRYAGVGMQIEDIRGNATVARVFPNTPAAGAGVAEGDRILMIDTLATRGWKLDQVSNALRGEPGTRVRVRFGRPGVPEPIEATFTRAVIHIPAVPYAMMLDGGVGYIPVNGFNETASDEVIQSIRQLQQKGMKSLVLDLRNNPGGILDEAFVMSNLFLPKGKEILSYRGRADMNQTFVSQEQPLLPDLPLVVLVDGESASASEIVAGALQDHDRAVLVGTTSFGKGLVQSLFRLDGGYALKMTTAKWFTPSGRSIQRPRKIVDGRFVEDEAPADSMESDSARKARPVFRSASGRTVYGGGGITPDLVVRPDTISTAEQKFARQLAPKAQDAIQVLAQYAEELRPQVRGLDFTVQPAWRAEYFKRIKAAGVPVDSALYESAAPYVNRMLGDRVAKAAFGDSAVARRRFGDDNQLQRAAALLRRSGSQREVFSAAGIPLPGPSAQAARRP
ncbi:MAG: S41 family peptidase [Gemmatimonadaceae bacterium]|nr:S41 family peptidase [Gemmatimonadaceae bacterium]